MPSDPPNRSSVAASNTSTSTLSPRDLARAVGVSESSVKRWADDGRLEVIRTAGGHRRIRVADAVRFVREGGMDVLRPDLLGMGPAAPVRSRSLGPTAESLIEAIEQADDAAARRMLVSAYVQGISVAALSDGAIRGALDALGRLWKEGPRGIALEHHAVDACVQALMEIRGTISVPKKAPLALGGAGEGDPYVLPSLVASVVLAEAGYRTLNLGPNVPTKAIVAAVEAQKPALVWRSFSPDVPAAELKADLSKIKAIRSGSTELVVGGRGVPRGVVSPGAGPSYFDSMTELAGFAKAARRSRRRR